MRNYVKKTYSTPRGILAWKAFLSKETLEKDYLIDKLRAKDIFKKYGIPLHICYQILKDYGLKKIKVIENKPTKEQLYQKYIVENCTIEETKAYFGISNTCLCNLIEQYKIFKFKKYSTFSINKDELYDKYIVKNMKIAEISAEYNISPGRISKLIKEYKFYKNTSNSGANKKKQKEKKERDKKITKLFYEGVSAKEMSDIFNIKEKSVNVILLKLGLRQPKKTTKDKISKEKLLEEYNDNNMTMEEIAIKYNLADKENVYRLMVKLNIPRRPSRTRIKSYHDLSISYWRHLQDGAEARKLEFSITKEYAWSLFEEQNKKCKLSGLDIVLVKSETHQKYTEQTASLDRINSKLGYIEGNVQWVHKAVNRIKWDMTEEVMFDYCKRIYEHLKDKYD